MKKISLTCLLVLLASAFADRPEPGDGPLRGNAKKQDEPELLAEIQVKSGTTIQYFEFDDGILTVGHGPMADQDEEVQELMDSDDLVSGLEKISGKGAPAKLVEVFGRVKARQAHPPARGEKPTPPEVGNHGEREDDEDYDGGRRRLDSDCYYWYNRSGNRYWFSRWDVIWILGGVDPPSNGCVTVAIYKWTQINGGFYQWMWTGKYNKACHGEFGWTSYSGPATNMMTKTFSDYGVYDWRTCWAD